MMRIPTITYVVGADLGDLGMFVIGSNGALINLVSGFTYSLIVGDGTSGTGGFTSTDGFTGAAGSGLPPSGTPNLVKQWATIGELNTLTGGVMYPAQLNITRISDSRQRMRRLYLEMIPSL